jgi:DNA-binding MarR family transcriptional regulator
MTQKVLAEADVALTYGLVWGWLHIANHRYGTMPTGEMQVTLTIVMLCSLGYDPTVTELAEITGLAKSNVSRYVSREMKGGFLEEYIDSADRRRRKLRPTAAAETELEWHQGRVHELFKLLREQQARGAKRPLDFRALLENLSEITDSVREKRR